MEGNEERAGPDGRLERVFEELVERALRAETLDLPAFLASHPELDARERERLELRTRVLFGSPVGALPFERLGDFRLVRKLGEGGMGVVYLARQESLGRLLALKLMRPELAGAEGVERRFTREARAIAQLRHPGIVSVHAAGEEQGVRYLALEYIEGRSLDEVLRTEGPHLSAARVVRWGKELAEALACAHAAGVVHRDVKPSNVRIDTRDRALVLDFGLARLAGASTLSQSGEFRGTPYYASPEQVEAREVEDERTDVYSLGATLYHCLTGRPPFEGTTSAQVFHGILSREPRAPRALCPAVSRELETVLLCALEKQPGRRYASAALLAEDLAALLEMRPIRARPPGPVTRLVKWTRRNRSASLVAGAALLGLLGFVGAGFEARRKEARRFEGERGAAETARARGDHEEALAALERALALRPEDGPTLARREDVRREAAVARADEQVRRARVGLERERTQRARLDTLRSEALPLRQAVTSRPMSAAESARLFALEGEVQGLEQELETLFAEILEALERARALDPAGDEAEASLAELYLERWRAAVAARDARGERHYRTLVESHDRAGRHAEELHGRLPFALASQPAGAEVFLFRYEELSTLVEHGEPRLVPVPVAPDGSQAPTPRPPGSWALRVVRPAGSLALEDLVLSVAGYPIEGAMLVDADGPANGPDGLRRFDRLVAIDGAPVRDAYDAHWLGEAEERERVFELERSGERFTRKARRLSELGAVRTPAALVERGGVPLQVLRGGRVEELVAPDGLEVRATAAPLFRSEACRYGPTPIAGASLPPGSYLALVCAPDHEPLRLCFTLARGRACELTATLLPAGTSPPGFVRIAAGALPVGGDAEAFATLTATVPELDDYWIQEREVGVREYLEFVNDFDTLAEIDASRKPVLVPRALTGAASQPLWKRLEDGTFEPPAHTLEQPVHGVSWHDAEAYARWRTARALDEGLAFEFALPTEIEWERAARGADLRPYPFGAHFVPRWVKGFFAREQLMLEPYLSFPIDESPWGAFDLTGSLWEWCRDDWDRLGDKTLRGGAWNFTVPAFFRAASRAGQQASAADGIYGFRLVARGSRQR